MSESLPGPTYEQKATILRERAFFAAFIGILFALAANGALFLIDQGLSILRSAPHWPAILIALALLLAGACVVAITGLLLIAALQNLRLAWKMEHAGQVAMCRVFKKEIRQAGRKFSYHIIYANDQNLRFVERVSESNYQRLNVGDAVEFRFLPGHPDIARLEK
jgi:hypothetical protein